MWLNFFVVILIRSLYKRDPYYAFYQVVVIYVKNGVLCLTWVVSNQICYVFIQSFLTEIRDILKTIALRIDDRKSAIAAILDFKIGSNLKDVIFFCLLHFWLCTVSWYSLQWFIWFFGRIMIVSLTLRGMQYFFNRNMDLITYSLHCAVSRHYFCCQASRNSTLWEKPGPRESRNFLMFRVKTLNWCL